MDKNTTNWKEFTLGNPQEDPPRRIEKKTRKRNHKLVWLLAVVAGLVTVVAVAMIWDRSSFDGLRRSVIYARADKDESGCALLYEYESDATSSFATLGGSLLCVNQSNMKLIDERGQTIVDETLHFSKAALVDNGDCAVVYDVGGKSIYVLSDKGIVRQMESRGEILAITINQQNQMAVTANLTGYKAGVCVYDEAGELIFEYDSSERFCMTAAMSGDGKYLGVVTMGRENNSFSSYLVIYRTTSDVPVTTCKLSDSVIYELDWVDGCFCAVGNGAMLFVKTNGTVTGNWSYGSDYLRRYSPGGGYAAVLLSHYRSGSQATLTLMGSDGLSLAAAVLDGEALSLSAAGRYVAVLYTDSLVIYDKALQVVARLDNISEARQVVMRSDGSAVLIGNTAARLYLP